MAKKFSFRLEPVLKLRSYKVSLAKDSLVQVLNQRRNKEQQISEHKNYYNQLLKTEINSTQASEFQAQYYHKNFIFNEIIKLNNEKEQLLEIESFHRTKLTEAMKQEKILKKLKEKKQDLYNEENQKEETLTLDEIARTRHGRS